MDKKINPWIVLINNLKPVEFLPYEQLKDNKYWQNWTKQCSCWKIVDGYSYHKGKNKEESEALMREAEAAMVEIERALFSYFRANKIDCQMDNKTTYVLVNGFGRKCAFYFHDWSVYYYSEF